MDSPATPTFFHRLADIGFKTCLLLFPTVITYIIINDGDGCGDTPRDFAFFPVAPPVAFGLALVWSIIDKQKRNYSKLHYALQILTRYFLAYTIMTYGMAKIIDMQFPSNLSGLDSNVVDMAPMSVAWTFFGYSYSYEVFIGTGQLLACILLIFRRTATLGAILLVTIMANIVYVNFAFNVCVKFFSSVYLAMALYLLLDDAVRLVNFFFLNKTAEKRVYPVLFRNKKVNRVYTVIGILAAILIIAYPAYRTISTKQQYGLGKHNEVYGVWKIDSLRTSSDSLTTQLLSDSKGWKKIIFDDFNYCYTRTWSQYAASFSCTINDTLNVIEMKETWPDSLNSIKVSYRMDKDTMYLHGLYNKDSIYTRLLLQRKYFLR